MFNNEGCPVAVPRVPSNASIEATPTSALIIHPADVDVRYTFETMYHIGSVAMVAGIPGAIYTGHELQSHVNAAGNGTYWTRGNATEFENRQAIKGRFSFRVLPSDFPNQRRFFTQTDHPRVRQGIGQVVLEFNGTPQLHVEMVKFSPAVRLAPVQSLWCPQNEFVFQSDASTTTGFKLTDDSGEPIPRQSA